MKKLFNLNLLIAFAIIFASCATNNNVVSNRLISKRKYTKGFHINRKGNMKSSKVEKEEESIAFQDVKSTKNKTKKGTYASNRTEDKAKDNATSNKTVQSDAVVVDEQPAKKSTAKEQFDGMMGDEENFTEEAEAPEDSESSNDLTTSEERMTKKQVKKKLRALKNRASNDDVMIILLVILALFIAPLAVGIYEGITTRFWITLILWLIGIGLGFWLFGGVLAFLCGLIAAIYAILIVIGAI